MGRQDKGAAVALMASAALAPATLPPEAEVTDHGDGTATVSVPGPSPDEWLSRVAELNTELGEARASAAQLADELALERTRAESLRAELAETRARFQAAWDEREREIKAASGLAPIAPSRIPIADAQLVLTLRGRRVVLMPGDEIPEGVVVASLPPGSVR